MSVQQALSAEPGGGSSFVLTFTSSFLVDGGGSNGVNPADNNNLAIMIFIGGSETITSIHSHNGTSNVNAFTAGSGASGYFFLHLNDIGTSITGVNIVLSASTGLLKAWIIEDDAALTENDYVAKASDGDGSVTDHGMQYATDEADELVFALAHSLGGSRAWSDLNDSNVFAASSSENLCGVYKEQATAETGDIEWTIDTASNCEAILVTYQRDSGSTNTTIEVPTGPLW